MHAHAYERMRTQNIDKSDRCDTHAPHACECIFCVGASTRTSGVHGPVLNRTEPLRTEPAVRFARFHKFFWRFGSVPVPDNFLAVRFGSVQGNFSTVRFGSGSRNESDSSRSVRLESKFLDFFCTKMEKISISEPKY